MNDDNENPLGDLFGRLLKEQQEADAAFNSFQDIDLLRLRHESLNVRHAFTPGMIVSWKTGLKNRKSAGPFIVIGVLKVPVFDKEGDSGSPTFREPLDILLGSLNGDGNLTIYHYDSRRFQPLAA